jgi:hypothetical protein
MTEGANTPVLLISHAAAWDVRECPSEALGIEPRGVVMTIAFAV